jgi:hypothetical protein
MKTPMLTLYTSYTEDWQSTSSRTQSYKLPREADAVDLDDLYHELHATVQTWADRVARREDAPIVDDVPF